LPIRGFCLRTVHAKATSLVSIPSDTLTTTR